MFKKLFEWQRVWAHVLCTHITYKERHNKKAIKAQQDWKYPLGVQLRAETFDRTRAKIINKLWVRDAEQGWAERVLVRAAEVPGAEGGDEVEGRHGRGRDERADVEKGSKSI
jgi:hypothetical protein